MSHVPQALPLPKASVDPLATPHIAIANQERYLLAERFTDTSYAARLTYRIRGRLDRSRLGAAITATCAAHQILRSRFTAHGTGYSVSIDTVPPRIDPDEVDLRHSPAPNDAAIRAAFVAYFYRDTDIFTPESMVRAQIIRLPHDESLVTLSLHHAISDGVSIRLFADEVYARYSGRAVEDAGAGYAEIMARADDARADDDCAYWTQRLAGLAIIPTLPADRDVDLARADKPMVTRATAYPPVMAAARAMGVMPFDMMAALSHLVLGRLTGQDDMVLTFQSAGRRRHRGSRRAIGPFSNTVVLRAALDARQPYDDFVRAQKSAIAEAVAHEACPYHRVIAETGVQPEFGLNWYPPQPPPDIAGVEVIGREFVYLETDFDLDLRFVAEDDTLSIYAIHDPGRHGADRIAALLDDLLAALAWVTAQPQLPLGEILPAPAPLAIPVPSSVPSGRLFDAFLDQAARRPERVALIAEGREITYGQLERASALLARRLVAAGLGPGSRIAILAERGPALVWTMLAVLRIGATMVPLDSEYPAERLRVLMGVARPDALLIPRSGPSPDWAEDVARVIAVRDESAHQPAPDAVPPGALAAGDPDAPAYILFTSGTTGTPKGVATSHRPALNFLRWQRETFDIGENDRFSNLNGVAHDMMIRDIFAPLSVGGQLVIPRQEDIFRPGFLLGWIAENRPTILHLTPAMGRLITLSRTLGQTVGSLRAMFFGGDRLLPALTREMAELAPGAQIVNFYGATETPQAAGFHRCDPRADWQSQPVGRGIDGMALRLVGPDRQPVPPGCPGEIAVLSPFLSLGYVTPGGIKPHPQPGIYFTGDTGIELPSGEILFTGREDDQVSIRGFRVELGEIGRTLGDHPGVEGAVVLMDDEADPPRMVAFAAGTDLDDGALYAHLRYHLPDYMVPRDIVVLDRLPLLPNGKLDRQALLRLPRTPARAAPVTDPRTETETALVAAWTKALGVPVGTERSFAELRGDSLSYVEVMLATEVLVGPLPQDWETRSLAEIAALAGTKRKTSSRLFSLRMVDSAVLVRAVAISSVVAFHFDFFHLIGGGTTALFLVTGYMLGRLQIRHAFQTGEVQPMFRLAWNLFLPLAIYTALLPIHGLMDGDRVPLPYLLMYSDFIAMDLHPPEGVEPAVYLWYVHAMLHMLMIIGAVLWLNFRLRLTHDPAYFVAGLLVLGLGLRFLLPWAIVPGYLEHGIVSLSAQNYLPTAHLATIALGMNFAFVTTLRERVMMLIIMLLYIGLSIDSYHMNGPILMLTFGVLVLFVPRVPLYAPLQRLVLVISGASLFIYLTHGKLGMMLMRLGIERGSFLQYAIAMAIGVALWYVWQRLYPVRRRLDEALFGRRGSPAVRADADPASPLSAV